VNVRVSPGVSRNDLQASADFQPFYPTLGTNVFCTRWLTPSGDQLFIIINRSGKDWPAQALLQVSAAVGSVVMDCYHGEVLMDWTTADFTVDVAAEALGFACVWVGNSSRTPSQDFLAAMSSLTRDPLAHMDNTWVAQHTVSPPHQFTLIHSQPPPGMILVPGGVFNFTTKGVEIEGPDDYGVDFQFPWEKVTQRTHSSILQMPPLFVDEFPVTNMQWFDYIKASSYKPVDDNYYLSWWSKPDFNISGDDGYRPVTWVSPEEAAGGRSCSL
jgi:iron(II)-dependent oxidoreductase